MTTATLWLALTIAGAILLAWALTRTRADQPEGMPVVYTHHARQRMNERGVSVTQVEAVLADPTRQIYDTQKNSVRLERDFGGRILKVWVVEPWPATSEIVIKTTAWKYQVTLSLPPTAVGRVIGRGGANVKGIQDQYGVRIKVNRDGTVRVIAGDQASLDAAQRQILTISEPFKACTQSPSEQPEEVRHMAKYSNKGNTGKSGSGSRSVSSARLHQKSGSNNAFGGYTKVSNTNGTFRMRKSA